MVFASTEDLVYTSESQNFPLGKLWPFHSLILPVSILLVLALGFNVILLFRIQYIYVSSFCTLVFCQLFQHLI